MSISGKTILQIVPEMDSGGVEQTVLDMARAIIEAGGRALVATRGGRQIAALESMGAKVILLPVHSKNPYVQWQNYGALRRLIRAEKIDLLHVRSRAPALATLMAARAEKVPIVSTYHGIYKANGALKRAYNGLMTRTDKVIANSDFTRAHILHEYPISPEKVIPIARGIDMQRFDEAAISPERVNRLRQSWNLKDDERITFVLGARLTPIKGQSVIIEAAARLIDRHERDFKIIMVGDDQGREAYSQSLSDAISQHGLSDHVFLVGHGSDMPAAFMLADFALCPSVVPEAFGRTAVEPQALGRPVLASKLGATVETIVEGVTGWLVTPADDQAWADAMFEAMRLSPQRRQEMANAAKAHVRDRFSLEKMCQKTLGVYASLFA